MISGKLYIDVECQQSCKQNKVVCGDVFLSKRIKEENRTIVVLADGLGSGIKANVLASLTANMIVNFVSLNQPLVQFTEIIMDTLPIDNFRKIGYSTFTIVDIDADGETRIIEYGNPPAIVIRNGEILNIEKKQLQLSSVIKHHKDLTYLKFQAQKDDRIFYMTDGITQSGIGRKDMPFGWETKGVVTYLKKMICKNPKISARDICLKVKLQALSNDIQKAQDDISCGLIHITEPKRLLLCSGPPFNKENDQKLASKVNHFKGFIVVSGGTTAEILSRELNKEIEVDINSATSSLPPLSKIEGIDIVSEGILTLGRISGILEHSHFNDPIENTAAGSIIQALMDHDEINIVVGTKVNNAHQDPSLPVELEIRRNVMKRIARLLETKFLKRVFVEYL
jgi:hypothetical protein